MDRAKVPRPGTRNTLRKSRAASAAPRAPVRSAACFGSRSSRARHQAEPARATSWRASSAAGGRGRPGHVENDARQGHGAAGQGHRSVPPRGQGAEVEGRRQAHARSRQSRSGQGERRIGADCGREEQDDGSYETEMPQGRIQNAPRCRRAAHPEGEGGGHQEHRRVQHVVEGLGGKARPPRCGCGVEERRAYGVEQGEAQGDERQSAVVVLGGADRRGAVCPCVSHGFPPCFLVG